MAMVWFVFDGPEQTGEPFGELLVRECVEKLKLEHSHRLDLPHGETPKLRGQRDRLREPKRVVVEILEGEDLNWPAGFYIAPISPEEARKAMLD